MNVRRTRYRRVRRSDLTPHGLKSAHGPRRRSARPHVSMSSARFRAPATAVHAGVSLETAKRRGRLFRTCQRPPRPKLVQGTSFSHRSLPKHNWQLSRPSRPSRRAHDIKSQSQSSQRSCQIIIHMRTRVGQIATARATQSAARRNLRLSPRTAHALLHVATGISPVSRRVSSFPSPSGRRCTAAGARSHSPCGP